MYRILIADDDAGVRSLLRVVVEQTGEFEVVGEAGNGLEAIESAKKLEPDIVILDVIMPVLDGLRALPKLVETGARIIMLTGLLHEDIVNRASLRGASAFVDKANVVDDLVETLRFTVGPLGDRSFLRQVSHPKLNR